MTVRTRTINSLSRSENLTYNRTVERALQLGTGAFMTLDQAVALSLLEDLSRVGLTPRLLESDPELVELAAPLVERAREERLRAAEAGIHVLAWNDPLMPMR
jgi:hypothetical protein